MSGSNVAPAAGFTALGATLTGRSNAFGLLRLVFASLVIFNHAFPLGGLGDDPLGDITKDQASMGSIAVLGFFGISGFLIAKSAQRLDVLQYLWHRVLRIFPAYWIVLGVGAAVVGPLVWLADGGTLDVYASRSPNGPISYVVGNFWLHIAHYGIYDIFADTTPYGHLVGASVFNGSLWTLIYEWRCYLIIAVLAVFGILTRARWVVLAATIFVGVLELLTVAAPQEMWHYLPLIADEQVLPLTLVFLIGSTFAVYRDKVLYDHRLGAFAIFMTLVTLLVGGFSSIGQVAFVYAILYLAVALPKAVQWIGNTNDYSYGIYIYGFLVQQVLAYLGVHRWGYWPYVVLTLVIAFGCAWLSWHLVEKRALRLKSVGPGKGIRHWWDAAAERVPWGRRTSE